MIKPPENDDRAKKPRESPLFYGKTAEDDNMKSAARRQAV